MSNEGAGAGGTRGYFTEGRGPGRGSDIAANRKSQKPNRRGIGNGDPIEINLDDLEQPGKGPVNFARRNGMKLTVDSGQSPGVKNPG